MEVQTLPSSDGLRIAYDVGGQGPALLLLHGAGHTREDWHRAGYVRQLAEAYTVITVDIRGSGDSDLTYEPSGYAIERICDDVLAVVSACRAGRFAVWGFSFGGNIARYLGAWSERVRAIVVGGVAFGPAVTGSMDGYVATLQQKWGAKLDAYRAGTMSRQEQSALERSRTAVWLPCFQAMRDWPDIDPDELRCPALLVAGSKNRGVVDWVEANRRSLESAKVEVEIIEGLTHAQEFHAVDRVLPLVRSFLDFC